MPGVTRSQDQSTILNLPMVSVVISHLNSSRTIEKCLTHLENVDYSPDKVEIIIVDGGSTDGSVQIVDKHTSDRVHQYLEPGCSESQGQNLGVQYCKGEIVMFTNSDVYVGSDWIKQHVARQIGGYELVSGAVFWGGDKFSLTWNQPIPNEPNPRMQVGFGLAFNNCSVNREFFLKSGGLKNLISQQDSEFGIRSIARGGHLLIDPEIEVYHDHPFKSFLGNMRRSFTCTANHVTLVRANFGKLVVGSGTPIVPPMKSFLKEVSMFNVAVAYLQLRSRSRRWDSPFRTGFVEFALIRLFSTKLGQLWGVLVGASKRGPSLSLRNMHNTKPTGIITFIRLPRKSKLKARSPDALQLVCD